MMLLKIKKQQLELDMKQQTGSRWERSTSSCVFSPCLFNLYAEYIMQNAGLDEAEAGIKITGRIFKKKRSLGEITITSDTLMTPPL